MTSFLDVIAKSSKETQKTRSLSHNPFKDIVMQKCGYQEIFGFKCDSSYVPLRSLQHLKKYIPYVELSELSERHTHRAFFTVACVCEASGNSYLLSDLRNGKRVMLNDSGSCLNIRPSDIIGVGSADVSSMLRIKKKESVIKIGHCNYIAKCRGSGGSDARCSGFVDTRDGPNCSFHCLEIVKSCGNRMLLKQINSPIVWDTKRGSSGDNGSSAESIFDRPTPSDVPESVIENYLREHPNGRSAKFARAIEQHKDAAAPRPKIGAGFEKGDLIIL